MRPISFAIPAHNESAVLRLTVSAIREACAKCGVIPEIVVADDASTDGTGELAASIGARVVVHDRRQIAATRNLAARATTHKEIVFVDADTRLTPEALREILGALDEGAAGGGVWVEFDHGVRWTGRLALWFTMRLLAILGSTGGACMFCRRDAFEAVGGFDETFYASEEVHFARSIATKGRFVIIRTPVITSARKLRTFSHWEIISVILKAAFTGGGSLKSRDSLDLWYGERRNEPVDPPKS